MNGYLSLKWKSWFRTSRRITPLNLLIEGIVTSVFVAFAVGAYVGIKASFAFMIEQIHLPVSVLHNLLASGLFALFMMTLVGNSITAFSAFFRSEEVEYLFTLPIKESRIFAIKFWENFFRSSTPMFLLGGASLAAYGTYFNLNWYQYLLIVFGVALPFVIAAAAIGSLVLLVIVYFSIKLSFRGVVMSAAGSAVGLSWLYFRNVNPVSQIKEVVEHIPNIQEYLETTKAGIGEMAFLPSTWFVRSIYGVLLGDTVEAAFYSLLLILAAGTAVFAVYAVARRIYYDTWLDSRELTFRQSNGAEKKAKSAIFNLRLPLSRHSEVLVFRDALLFVRDPSQWVHLLVFIFLLLAFIINMNGMTLYFNNSTLMTLLFIANFIFCGFFLVALAVRFIFPAVSQEGRQYWILKSSPVSPRLLFVQKGLFSLFFLLLIGVPLIWFTSRAMYPNESLFHAGVSYTALTAIVVASLNLSAGAWFADMRENSPLRIASSRGATLSFLASMFYLTTGAGLLAAIAGRAYTGALEGIEYDSTAATMLTGYFGIASAVVVIFSLVLGYYALLREEHTVQ